VHAVARGRCLAANPATGLEGDDEGLAGWPGEPFPLNLATASVIPEARLLADAAELRARLHFEPRE